VLEVHGVGEYGVLIDPKTLEILEYYPGQ
jgi:hypothetical protein